MAHSNLWDETSPPGTQQARTADDEFRKLKLDIRERMNDIVVDWTADPVALREVGGGTGQFMVFGPHIRVGEVVTASPVTYKPAFTRVTGTTVFELSTDTDPHYAFGSIIVPPGITITEFRAWMDKNGATAAECDFIRFNLSTGASTLVGSIVRTATGYGSDAFALSALVEADHVYNLRFRMVPTVGNAGNARFYACRITYNRPDFNSVF
jgi:hypothetical protein